MLSVSRDVFIGGAVAGVHPVKSMRITSFSDAWSTYEPSGGSSAGLSRHVARSSVYTRNRMFPACSRVFSLPGRITSTLRPC